jgi:protein-tyrosine phosphatase
MLDIHCHILPNIDDGSPNMETSLEMARIAAKDGVQTIIATPHIGESDYPRETILTAIRELETKLAEHDIPITILFGAELEAHIALAAAEQFCLAESSFLLMEFPHTYLPNDADDLIYTLINRGITPIIAHPERNAQIAQEPWLLRPLLELGAKAQVTAASITGELGMAAKTCATYLLQNKMVHYIASDSHSPGFRKPILSKAVKQAAKIIGKKEAEKLVSNDNICFS